MQIKLPKGLPQKATKKAIKVLESWKNGEIKATKLWNQKNNKPVLKIDIGRDYRAITKNHGENWIVLSHEKYNSFLM